MLVSPAAVMSAKEYYESTPGQRVQSPDSFWKSGDQPPTTQVPPLNITRKGSRDDYISPADPNFTLTNFPSSTFAGANNAEGAALSPPPKPIPTPMPHDHHDAMRSPPAPHSPGGSQVTDESDDSLVHIHLPGTHSHSHPQPQAPPPAAPRPPSNPRRSDSVSLTQSNLLHHTVGQTGTSSMVTPLRGSYSHYTSPSSSRKRLRAKELATHGKDTLIQMLVKQEASTDESRKLLRGALDKLEQYKLDLVEANNHCRRLERACQKLTDERMLMHTQVTEAMGKSQQHALNAQQELAVCKLKLEHTEQTLATANADLRQAKLQVSTTTLENERLRTELHHLREKSNLREAREQGRKQGYDEGVQQARVPALPRQITQAGEPSGTTNQSNNNSIVVGDGGAFIEDPNTTTQSTTANTTAPVPSTSQGHVRSSSRSSTSSSLTTTGTARDPRALKASFESALQQARAETEHRLQRELEHQLNAERQRLQLLNLQHEQNLERASRDQSEQFQKMLSATQQQTQVQMQELKELERRLKEELRKEREVVERVREERDQERERREREEWERRKEREERERERQAYLAEQARLANEREKERREVDKRERARDQVVAEANATAARAVQAAADASNAVANVSAAASGSTRPSSETSGSDHEHARSFPVPPLPYIPMPRPPMNMPVPQIPQSGSAVTMPEPTIPTYSTSSLISSRPSSRSVQPTLPQTVSVRHASVGVAGAGGRNRRHSIESQSSVSTVAGALDSLVSFPHAVPSDALGRTSSNDSNGRGRGGGGAPIYGRPGSNGGRDGPYGNPERESRARGGRDRDALSDIPEDASVRSGSVMSPSAPVVPPLPVLNTRQSHNGGQQPPVPRPSPYVLAGGRGGASGRYSNPREGRERESDDDDGPVVPTITVEPDNWRSGEREDEDDERPVNPDFLNPRGLGAGLRRSDSSNSARPSIRSNSSYEIVVEPPSNPTSPRESRSQDPHSMSQHQSSGHNQPPHSMNPNEYLSPLHATVPIPPVQAPTQPRGTTNTTSSSSSRTRTRTGSSSGTSRGWGDQDNGNAPTEPSSPVIPGLDAQSLPVGFVPRVFTPHSAPAPSLPDAGGPTAATGESLPAGFVPQSITDTVTGITTPLSGMPSALPSVGGGGNGNGGSRRASIYGGGDANEQAPPADWSGAGWGSGQTYSPYRSSGSPLPTGPPVIPKGTGWGALDDSSDSDPPHQRSSGSRRNTPSQGTRSIYGTPGGLSGSTRNLPMGSGTPVGGGVYQNPLRRDEGGDGEGEGEGDMDEELMRNTKINATAPLPGGSGAASGGGAAAGGRKKKKKGGRS
ncbi:hypothetical protein D9756_009984 [Leucocoprinus leucothites]|uniref:Uncharacterized protein n=1 Tax=Leucocoprinus leucothites TaxID=201217 RepID=A0A8H5CSI6_9AGAR|nr:hypothetical protein D9756_009984 [Leucoagaricus leucothites]